MQGAKNAVATALVAARNAKNALEVSYDWLRKHEYQKSEEEWRSYCHDQTYAECIRYAMTLIGYKGKDMETLNALLESNKNRVIKEGKK